MSTAEEVCATTAVESSYPPGIVVKELVQWVSLTWIFFIFPYVPVLFSPHPPVFISLPFLFRIVINMFKTF
jgi:hypothetical protein